MSHDYLQLAKDLNRAIAILRQGATEPLAGFSAMAKAATAQGTLDPKTKELIATAISVAVRCDGCIAFHVKAARRQGATREEMVETIAMAVYMGGGPSLITGAQTLEAWDQFEAAEAKADA